MNDQGSDFANPLDVLDEKEGTNFVVLSEEKLQRKLIDEKSKNINKPIARASDHENILVIALSKKGKELPDFGQFTIGDSPVPVLYCSVENVGKFLSPEAVKMAHSYMKLEAVSKSANVKGIKKSTISKLGHELKKSLFSGESSHALTSAAQSFQSEIGSVKEKTVELADLSDSISKSLGIDTASKSKAI